MTPRTVALISSPIGLLLLSVARLLIISDYNPTTAVTVATSTGYVNTLLGSLIPLMPVFLPYIALLLLLSRQFLLSVIAFVFTAFISPTPLSLPLTLRLARADGQQLLDRFSADRVMTVIIIALILGLAWYHYHSITEAIGTTTIVVATAGLVLAASVAQLSLPPQLGRGHTATRTITQRVLVWAAQNVGWALLVGAALVAGFLLYSRTPGMFATSLVAVLGTLAFFPYVYNVYPVPHQPGYYAQALHEPWLPAEKFKLNSDQIYYGYTLSADSGWFTVLLLNSRTIRYIPAGDVVSRVMCRPALKNQPTPYLPLVRTFYFTPGPVPGCPAYNQSGIIAAVKSHGQSLSAISATVHATSSQIITATNAHQHQRLSRALRRYERSGNWNAPTPIGQRFWYYPAITS